MTSTSRLSTVDCLRGVAASAVAWFHLTNGNPDFSAPWWLKASGRHGWLGVEVFFVISGFVIPYALDRARYQLRDFWTFLARRIVRLDPPYLASMAVGIALAYASTWVPGFRGPAPTYSGGQILSHVAYLTDILGFKPIIAVYWSLALEFQYYLFIGIVFPLIGHRRVAVRMATLAGLGVLAVVVRSQVVVFSWFFLFLLGILSFYYRRQLVNVWAYGIAMGLAGAGAWFTLGGLEAGVALATALVITFVELRSAPLLFLGEISYSLYLLHVPIAGRVINAATHVSFGPFGTTLATLVAFAVAVASAWVFHQLVEKPARRWAGRISYRAR